MIKALSQHQQLISWLTQHPGSTKHQGWLHPLTTFILHYIITICTSILLHDNILLPLLSNDDNNNNNTLFPNSPTSLQIHTSDFILIYTALIFILRLLFEKPIIRRTLLYEYTWMCNTTLILSSIGLRTCRPIIATSSCISVSIDQVMWYIDIPSYVFFRKFPIGVAKYLTWKNKHWSTKITCTHHIWTLPLVFYACDYTLHCASYLFSIYLMIVQVIISSWMIPPCIALKLPANNNAATSNTTTFYKYLNINLSYELWKDITFSFLQISYDNPPKYLYLFRLFWKWSLLNLFVFILLYNFLFVIE